jgi:hypothetical protein
MKDKNRTHPILGPGSALMLVLAVVGISVPIRAHPWSKMHELSSL